MCTLVELVHGYGFQLFIELSCAVNRCRLNM
jgi:hypothetical protein